MKTAYVKNITTKLSNPGEGMVWNGRVAEGTCGECNLPVFKDATYGWSHEDFNTSCGCNLVEQPVPQGDDKLMEEWSAVLAQAKQIDEASDKGGACWESLCVGWAIAKGMTVEQAFDFGYKARA